MKIQVVRKLVVNFIGSNFIVFWIGRINVLYMCICVCVSVVCFTALTLHCILYPTFLDNMLLHNFVLFHVPF